MSLTTSPAIALALAVAPAAAQEVWIVDASGAGDFLDTPAAVAAAAPGDVLVVRSGTYSGIDAVGKGLAVVGQGSPRLGPVWIEALPAAEDFVLSGFTVVGDLADPKGQGVGLTATACDGVVWVQDSFVQFDPALCGNSGFSPGTAVDGCTIVHFVGCELEGADYADAFDSEHADGSGLYAGRSSVHVAATTVRGGSGWEVCWDGQDALVAATSDVVLSGAHVLGGDAIDAYASTTGGAGMRLLDGARAWHRDSAVLGGEEGCKLFCGDPGPDWAVSTDSEVIALPGGARTLRVTGAGLTNDSVDLEFEGEPGDRLWLFWSTSPGAELREEWGGLLSLGEPREMLRAQVGNGSVSNATVIDFPGTYYGTIGASGVETVNVPTKDFPPSSGVEAETVFCQALHVRRDGTRLLSTPFAMTIKDL